MATHVLGVDIGGTKTAVLLGDLNCRPLARLAFPTRVELGPAQTVEAIVAGLWQLMREAGLSTSDIAGIGVSCGGPLDKAGGRVMSPPNLPGWDGVPIVSAMTEEFGLPAYLENDANACAVAEWRLGSGRGADSMAFMTFGTGLGAGLIIGGRLYEGANGNGGEVGHIRLAPRGPVGYGKAGSFEGFCSGGGIAQLALSAGMGQVTARGVAEAAHRGDEVALSVLRKSGRYLGRGLSILIDILNPEVIAIGSIFIRCHDMIWPEAEKVLRREALPQALSACHVVPAALGEEIGDCACLYLGLGEAY